MRPTLLRRLLGSTIVAVALATAVSALPVAAAQPRPAGAPQLHISGTLGLPCIFVEVTTGGQVTVTQRRKGVVIATRTVPAVDGNTRPCLKPLKPGDRLTMRRGENVVKATVPEYSATVNRAQDVVSGTFPVASGFANAQVDGRIDGVLLPWAFYGVATPITDETWSVDTTGTFDIARGDRVIAAVSADHVWRIVLSARTVFVEVGLSRISGTGPIGGTVGVTVKANGAVRGTLQRAVRLAPTDRAGTFSGTLRKNGAAVKVKAGDRIFVKGLAGSLTVPARSLEVLPALNGATAECPGPSAYLFSVNGAPTTSGSTSDGEVVVGPVTLSSGDSVTLRCALPSGFGTRETVEVP